MYEIRKEEGRSGLTREPTLLLEFWKTFPVTPEQEADAAHRLGVFYESSVETDKVKKTYKKIAEESESTDRKKKKRFSEAQMLLDYWNTSLLLAHTNYERAVLLDPTNSDYKRSLLEAEHLIAVERYRKAVLTEPNNTRYKEVLAGLEMDLPNHEFF